MAIFLADIIELFFCGFTGLYTDSFIVNGADLEYTKNITFTIS